MLATFPTYIARAKRSKKPLCIVGIEQVESAAAAIHAAALSKSAIGLLISDFKLISPVLSIAHFSEEPVIVIATCSTSAEVEKALNLGVGAVCIKVTTVNLKPSESLLIGAAASASARNACCLVEWPATNAIPILLARSGVVGVILSVPEGTDTATIRVRGTEGVKLNIPLLLEIHHASRQVVKQLRNIGLAGYYARLDVEEGYTAGLRTALRNRSVTTAHQYVPYGMKAAEEITHNLIKTYS